MRCWVGLAGQRALTCGCCPALTPRWHLAGTAEGISINALLEEKVRSTPAAGIALALLLQGGSGPDKLSCFHLDYFSFKPSASVELMMRMVSLAVPPIPLLPLMLGLSHCFHSAQRRTPPVAVCLAGPALVSPPGEQRHHGRSSSTQPSPTNTLFPKGTSLQVVGAIVLTSTATRQKTPTGEEVLHSSKTAWPPTLGPRGRGSLGGRAGGQAGDMGHLHPTVRSGPSCPTWSPKLAERWVRHF